MLMSYIIKRKTCFVWFKINIQILKVFTLFNIYFDIFLILTFKQELFTQFIHNFIKYRECF